MIGSLTGHLEILNEDWIIMLYLHCRQNKKSLKQSCFPHKQCFWSAAFLTKLNLKKNTTPFWHMWQTYLVWHESNEDNPLLIKELMLYEQECWVQATVTNRIVFHLSMFMNPLIISSLLHPTVPNLII